MEVIGDKFTADSCRDHSQCDKSQQVGKTVVADVFAPNRDGLTVDILKVLVDDGVPVLNVNARALKNDSAVIDLSMKIKGKEQLEFICKKILQISGVDRIERVTT